MFDLENHERVLKNHINFFKEHAMEILNEAIIHTVLLGLMKDGIHQICLTLKDHIGHDKVIAK